MERVVRIEGRVSRVERAESEAYYESRPLDSRLGAWASPQSEVISSRAPCWWPMPPRPPPARAAPALPAALGGYRLEPDRFEFWQGRRSRLHDRLVYRFTPEQGWRLERLAPLNHCTFVPSTTR